MAAGSQTVEGFSDESWVEFFEQPMQTLIDGTSGNQPPSRIGERAKRRRELALAVVGLLSLFGVVAGVVVQRAGRTEQVAASGAGACDPIDLRDGAPIPEVTPCSAGVLRAAGELDLGWNGILSGWSLSNDELRVEAVWENWDDGTLGGSGVIEWQGADSHADTDPADNRYQEIRVLEGAPGSFTIYESRGLLGRSVTFTFEPDAAVEAESRDPETLGPQDFSLVDGTSRAVKTAEKTTVVWNGQSIDGDTFIAWEEGSEPSGNTVQFAQLASGRLPARSVSGVLTLDPSPIEPRPELTGGLYVRFYAAGQAGWRGGQSAQLGLINTAVGPIVDRSSGICPPAERCGAEFSGTYVTAESVDLDASAGIRFKVELEDGELQMTLRSVADPEAAEATVAVPFADGIRLVSLEAWGTTWPFVGAVEDLAVEYGVQS